MSLFKIQHPETKEFLTFEGATPPDERTIDAAFAKYGRATSPSSGFAGDIPRLLSQGVDTIGIAGGQALDFMGADKSGEYVKDLFRNRMAETQKNLTPETQNAPQLYDETKGTGFFDSARWNPSLRGIARDALVSLPASVATMAVTKNPVAAFETWLAQQALRKSTASALGFLGTGAIVGGGEGGIAALQNSADTKQEILDAGGSLSDADNAAKEVAIKTLLTTGGLSGLSGGGAIGALNRRMGLSSIEDATKAGFVKPLVKGMMTEAAEEFPQSGMEEYYQNVARRDYLDKTIDPWKGTLGAAIQGAASGMMTGAGFGAVEGSLNKLQSKPVVDTTTSVSLLDTPAPSDVLMSTPQPSGAITTEAINNITNAASPVVAPVQQEDGIGGVIKQVKQISMFANSLKADKLSGNPNIQSAIMGRLELADSILSKQTLPPAFINALEAAKEKLNKMLGAIDQVDVPSSKKKGAVQRIQIPIETDDTSSPDIPVTTTREGIPLLNTTSSQQVAPQVNGTIIASDVLAQVETINNAPNVDDFFNMERERATILKDAMDASELEDASQYLPNQETVVDGERRMEGQTDLKTELGLAPYAEEVGDVPSTRLLPNDKESVNRVAVVLKKLLWDTGQVRSFAQFKDTLNSARSPYFSKADYLWKTIGQMRGLELKQESNELFEKHKVALHEIFAKPTSLRTAKQETAEASKSINPYEGMLSTPEDDLTQHLIESGEYDNATNSFNPTDYEEDITSSEDDLIDSLDLKNESEYIPERDTSFDSEMIPDAEKEEYLTGKGELKDTRGQSTAEQELGSVKDEFESQRSEAISRDKETNRTFNISPPNIVYSGEFSKEDIDAAKKIMASDSYISGDMAYAIYMGTVGDNDKISLKKKNIESTGNQKEDLSQAYNDDTSSTRIATITDSKRNKIQLPISGINELITDLIYPENKPEPSKPDIDKAQNLINKRSTLVATEINKYIGFAFRNSDGLINHPEIRDEKMTEGMIEANDKSKQSIFEPITAKIMKTRQDLQIIPAIASLKGKHVDDRRRIIINFIKNTGSIPERVVISKKNKDGSVKPEKQFQEEVANKFDKETMIKLFATQKDGKYVLPNNMVVAKATELFCRSVQSAIDGLIFNAHRYEFGKVGTQDVTGKNMEYLKIKANYLPSYSGLHNLVSASISELSKYEMVNPQYIERLKNSMPEKSRPQHVAFIVNALYQEGYSDDNSKPYYTNSKAVTGYTDYIYDSVHYNNNYGLLIPENQKTDDFDLSESHEYHKVVEDAFKLFLNQFNKSVQAENSDSIYGKKLLAILNRDIANKDVVITDGLGNEYKYRNGNFQKTFSKFAETEEVVEAKRKTKLKRKEVEGDAYRLVSTVTVDENKKETFTNTVVPDASEYYRKTLYKTYKIYVKKTQAKRFQSELGRMYDPLPDMLQLFRDKYKKAVLKRSDIVFLSKMIDQQYSFAKILVDIDSSKLSHAELSKKYNVSYALINFLDTDQGYDYVHKFMRMADMYSKTLTPSELEVAIHNENMARSDVKEPTISNKDITRKARSNEKPIPMPTLSLKERYRAFQARYGGKKESTTDILKLIGSVPESGMNLKVVFPKERWKDVHGFQGKWYDIPTGNWVDAGYSSYMKREGEYTDKFEKTEVLNPTAYYKVFQDENGLLHLNSTETETVTNEETKKKQEVPKELSLYKVIKLAIHNGVINNDTIKFVIDEDGKAKDLEAFVTKQRSESKVLEDKGINPFQSWGIFSRAGNLQKENIPFLLPYVNAFSDEKFTVTSSKSKSGKEMDLKFWKNDGKTAIKASEFKTAVDVATSNMIKAMLLSEYQKVSWISDTNFFSDLAKESGLSDTHVFKLYEDSFGDEVMFRNLVKYHSDKQEKLDIKKYVQNIFGEFDVKEAGYKFDNPWPSQPEDANIISTGIIEKETKKVTDSTEKDALAVKSAMIKAMEYILLSTKDIGVSKTTIGMMLKNKYFNARFTPVEQITEAQRAEINSAFDLFTELVAHYMGDYKSSKTQEAPIKYSPEVITSLKPNEVFVFFGNEEGKVGKYAAGTGWQYDRASFIAGDKFKRPYAQPIGYMEGKGATYAIPTKKMKFSTAKRSIERTKIELEKIRNHIRTFLEYAKDHPSQTFIVYEDGSDYSYKYKYEDKRTGDIKWNDKTLGYDSKVIGRVFSEVLAESGEKLPNNVVIPESFDRQKAKKQEYSDASIVVQSGESVAIEDIFTPTQSINDNDILKSFVDLFAYKAGIQNSQVILSTSEVGSFKDNTVQKVFEDIAKMFDSKLVVVNVPAYNGKEMGGYFDHINKVVVVNAGRSRAMADLFGHETFHNIYKKLSAGKQKSLRDLLYKHVGRDADTAYKKLYGNKTNQEISEEILADMFADVLFTKEFWTEFHAMDRSLAQKVIDGFVKFIKGITESFNKYFGKKNKAVYEAYVLTNDLQEMVKAFANAAYTSANGTLQFSGIDTELDIEPKVVKKSFTAEEAAKVLAIGGKGFWKSVALAIKDAKEAFFKYIFSDKGVAPEQRIHVDKFINSPSMAVDNAINYKAKKGEAAGHSLSEFKQKINVMSNAQWIQLIDDARTGKIKNNSDKDIRIFFAICKELADISYNRLMGYFPELKDKYNANHYGMFMQYFKDAVHNDTNNFDFIRSHGDYSVLEGTKGYLHKRSGKSVAEMIIEGSEPKLLNPLDLILNYVSETERAIGANKMFYELTKQGNTQYVTDGSNPKEGYTFLDDGYTKIVGKVKDADGGLQGVLEGYSIKDPEGNVSEIVFPSKEMADRRLKELGAGYSIVKLINKSVKERELEIGRIAVPSGIARMLNNYMSIDRIRRRAFGRTLLSIKNWTTALELALSGFHATAITQELLATMQAHTIMHNKRGGTVAGKLGNFIMNSPVIQMPLMLTGTKSKAGMFHKLEEINKLYDEMLANKEVYKDKGFQKRAQDILKVDVSFKDIIMGHYLSGMQHKQDPSLQFKKGQIIYGKGFVKSIQDIINKDMQDIYGDGKVSVSFDNIMEHIAKAGKATRSALSIGNKVMSDWLFEEYIPRAKFAAFALYYSQWLADNQNSTELEKHTKAVDLTKFIEKLYGEMNWNNLHANKAFKTSLQLMFRSFTWQYGTWAALVDGLSEIGKVGLFNVKKIVGMGKGEKEIVLTEKGLWFLSALSTHIFTVFMLQAVLAAFGINKDDEDDKKDIITDMMYLYVGDQKRLAIASYPDKYYKIVTHLMDAVAYNSPQEVTKLFTGGLTGVTSKMINMYQNDNMGRQIYNSEQDNIIEVGGKLAKYAFVASMPISFQSARKFTSEGGDVLPAIAMGAIGSTEAGMHAKYTKLEQYLLRNKPKMPATDEEKAEHKLEIKQAATKLEHGDRSVLNEMISSKVISKNEIKDIEKRAKTINGKPNASYETLQERLLKSVSIEKVEKAIEIAKGDSNISKLELLKLKAIANKKIGNIKSADITAKKAEIISSLRKELKTIS